MLATHSVARFGLGLRPLCDLAEIIRAHGDTLAWPEVQARAVEWHAERFLYLALWLTRELLGRAVPQSVMEGLCPRDFTERWAALALKQVLEAREALSQAAGLPEIPSRVWLWGCRYRWRRGQDGSLVRAALRAVFPPRDYMAQYMADLHLASLDGFRRFSCYLTRAGDWLRKTGHWAWQRAAQPRRMAESGQLAREQDQFWDWLSSQAATIEKLEPVPTATAKA